MTDKMPQELRDFAELMVDEVLSRLRAKIENGGWSIEEQREIIAVCIAEQDVKRDLRSKLTQYEDAAPSLARKAASAEKLAEACAELNKRLDEYLTVGSVTHGNLVMWGNLVKARKNARQALNEWSQS